MLISARVRKVRAHDLLNAIGHRFDEIESELDELTQLRDKPEGTVRIACGDHILRTTILPKLAPLLREYPHIKMEFDVDYGFRDIIADRFDAGVRLGATIDKDMIAAPIGPPLRMTIAASPEYFDACQKPKEPHDSPGLNCINMRLQTSRDLCLGPLTPRSAAERSRGRTTHFQHNPQHG